MNNWIPCDERLPKESDGKVLVTHNSNIGTAIYSEFSNTWYHSDFMSVSDTDPIAWMPMPKPYEPNEKKSNDFTHACDLCVHKNVMCNICMTADKWKPKETRENKLCVI